VVNVSTLVGVDRQVCRTLLWPEADGTGSKHPLAFKFACGQACGLRKFQHYMFPSKEKYRQIGSMYMLIQREYLGKKDIES
jgi:hypothetical protein